VVVVVVNKKRTVTGASTRCTLLSSTSISRARKQSALTSPSRKYSHRFNRSICSSRQLLPLAAVNDDAVILVVHWCGAVVSTGLIFVIVGGCGPPPPLSTLVAMIAYWDCLGLEKQGK
jgi:hypothetical protein